MIWQNVMQKKYSFWIFSWIVGFTFAMSIAKLLSKDLHGFILLFVRYFFGVMFLTPVILSNLPLTKILKSNKIALHILRGVFVCLATGCTYAAYRNIALPMATCIGFTAPLITSVLALLFLSEKLNKKKVIALLLGYGGVFVMFNPKGCYTFNIFILMAVLANLFASSASILSKYLTKTESSFTILLYPSLIGLIIASALMPFFWVTPDLKDLLLLAVIGFLGTLSQFSYIKALSFYEASYIAPLEYTRLILAIIIGYFCFDEVMEWQAIAGAVLIIVGTFVLIKKEKIKENV